MSYQYEGERNKVFLESNQKMFLSIRDRARGLLDSAGAFNLASVIAGCSGDSWTMIACVDRLVELGEIKEVAREHCAGQYRIFVKTDE